MIPAEALFAAVLFVFLFVLLHCVLKLGVILDEMRGDMHRERYERSADYEALAADLREDRERAAPSKLCKRCGEIVYEDEIDKDLGGGGGSTP